MNAILGDEAGPRKALTDFQATTAKTADLDLSSDEVYSEEDYGPSEDASDGADSYGAEAESNQIRVDIDNRDSENLGYAAVDLGLNARNDVSDWRILAVGKRPHDFIARDCLFGSLFRDHRAPWFHRYVRKPEPWMKKLVGHLPAESQPQALRYVVLHYLHKLHLIRLFEWVYKEFGEDCPEIKALIRLFRCPPCTVLVERANPDDYDNPMPHCCGMTRACPWCFARKVTQIHACIRKQVLAGDVKDKYLFLAKATFAEPFFGVDERWQREDLYAIGGAGAVSWVRDYYGRYFGLRRERAIETRNYLMKTIRDSVDVTVGSLKDGVVTHQIGSAQDSNGRRTYMHDIGVFGVVDRDFLECIRSDRSIVTSDSEQAIALRWAADKDLVVDGLIIPAAHPSALRTVIAGTSWGYDKTNFGLDRSNEVRGVAGALSWQPTFLLDDQVWFRYAETTRHLHLYHPFGNWRETLGNEIAESRASVDGKFERVQRARITQNKQQKGNNKRHRDASERRQGLLKVAEPLWPGVVAAARVGRGRPAYRGTLEESLKAKGITASRRDLDWLVKAFLDRNRIGQKQAS